MYAALSHFLSSSSFKRGPEQETALPQGQAVLPEAVSWFMQDPADPMASKCLQQREMPSRASGSWRRSTTKALKGVRAEHLPHPQVTGLRLRISSWGLPGPGIECLTTGHQVTMCPGEASFEPLVRLCMNSMDPLSSGNAI